jgi:hypothetical protein
MTSKIFTYKGHEVKISPGHTSRGVAWVPYIDGKPIVRKGQVPMCSASIWAEKDARETIDAL